MTQYSVNNLPPAIQAWKSAVEDGLSPREIAETCYHEKGVLKGTVWAQAVQGHDRITQYFEHFTAGKNGATVTFDTLTETPGGSYAGEYTFRWKDNTGQPQKTEANYSFEPVTDQDQELISLHHSSLFPPES